MKVIGLIGGMSWESTALYYRIINETVRARLGSLHSARLMLASIDFQTIERLQHAGLWEEAGELLADNARSIQAAGAQNVVLCTNTMHKVADRIASAVGIPLLHIADPTGAAIVRAGHRRVGLLGTRFTMEQDFYRARLQTQFDLDVLTPDADDRDVVHRIIYEELCLGSVIDASRHAYREVMARLIARGAEAIVMGCTEITMLIDASDSPVPLFDTTHLHAVAAAEWSIQDE
ncbi:aspartate/glutamate racemase family protein [Povalibacter sp.]|uniref:aspartate/glutamate racemase family protein n=1 Tax=Povalibacter sp. TaxID=1962978 RepID=UPI002F4217C8